MKHQKKVKWMKLDNASKIFPAVCNNKDTKVFRIYCELYEPIDRIILQKALDETMKLFPFYKSVLRRGVFWYYFETSNIKPEVKEESEPVCAPLYNPDKQNLLFRVVYYNCRIILEVFHALSDGTGALWFMQSLLYHYLLIKHSDIFSDEIPDLNYTGSISGKMDDSFDKYFSGEDVILNTLKSLNFNKIKPKQKRAYNVRGLKNDEHRLKITEGLMDVNPVLNEARKYETTLTCYIASLFIYSIYKDMPARKRNRPIALSIPINLRKYFESESARNFFGTMSIAYEINNDVNFDNIVESVKNSFQQELNKERLLGQLNKLVAIENNPIARIMPLPVKDFTLRIANKINDLSLTCAVSNLGRITMPVELTSYIRHFGACSSTLKPHITVCSFGDKLSVNFSSPFQRSEIERNFFRYLSGLGIEIEVVSNM